MSKIKDVTGAEVRAWAVATGNYTTEACLQPGARGRLAPVIVTDFNEAHKGKKRYGKVKVAKTVTLPVPHENKAGAITIRQDAVDHATAAEARPLAGLGKRGALSDEGAATLGAAFAVLQDA